MTSDAAAISKSEQTRNKEGLVAILILFFNKLNETVECITSFLPSGQNIYVLNNGSDNKLWQWLQDKYANVRQLHFLHSDINLGPASGRNRLIAQSTEPWLFLVDNDITIKDTTGWMEVFDEFILEKSSVQIINPRLFNIHENEFCIHPVFSINENKLELSYAPKATTNYFPAGAAIVSREVFENYGLFDEDLFAFEDYEFAIRALSSRQGALQAHNCSEILLIHNHKFQKAASDKEAVRQRYNKNRLQQSFAKILSKYKIEFEHDWEWWSSKQLEEMTVSLPLRKIKTILKNILGR